MDSAKSWRAALRWYLRRSCPDEDLSCAEATGSLLHVNTINTTPKKGSEEKKLLQLLKAIKHRTEVGLHIHHNE